MTTHVLVLSVALGMTALVDWVAVARDDHTVERITKPTFALLLIGLAWSLGSDLPAAPVVSKVVSPVVVPVLAALGLGLIADALLLTATTARYAIGLLVEMLANVAWVWALVGAQRSGGFPWWVPAALLALLVVHGAWGRHVVRYSGRQRGVVFLSLLVLVALVLVAAWLEDWVVLLGCGLLLVAYLVRGHDRFVLERRVAPFVAAATRELGQLLVVLGLFR